MPVSGKNILLSAALATIGKLINLPYEGCALQLYYKYKAFQKKNLTIHVIIHKIWNAFLQERVELNDLQCQL